MNHNRYNQYIACQCAFLQSEPMLIGICNLRFSIKELIITVQIHNQQNL